MQINSSEGQKTSHLTFNLLSKSLLENKYQLDWDFKNFKHKLLCNTMCFCYYCVDKYKYKIKNSFRAETVIIVI